MSNGDQTAQHAAETRTAEANAKAAEANTKTAEANAKAAEVDAEKKRREEDEAATPAAKALREAERAKAAAQASNDTLTAQRSEVASLIPDFSKVERGKLEPGSQPLFGGTLAQAALKKASGALVGRLASAIPAEHGSQVRLLITSDASLVDSDATYRQVLAGTKWLNESSKALLQALEPPDPAETVHALAVVGVLGALAAAVPGVLSLFSAHRAITSSVVEPGDLAAAAAVAGEFRAQQPSWEILHDEIRILSGQTRIEAELRELNEQRQKLATLKLNATAGSPQAAQLDAALQAVDAFVTGITAIPTAGTHSPLMTAMLRDELHPPEGSAGRYVLVVKSQGGSAQGVTDDKPLWLKDKFSTVAALSLTYFMLSSSSPGLLAAGILTGTATGTGTIGNEMKVETTMTDDA
jgi:hypothetical protein